MSSPTDIVIPRRGSSPRPPPAPRRGWRWWVWLLLGCALLLMTPPAAVLALRWLPPPTTAFMLQSEVQPVHYRWVPAAQIAESARKAAVAAEDQKFWTHFGFDLAAIEKALEHNEKSKRKRGASTITQQVAKNLFLWPGRSWLRKGVEVSFTVLLELMLTKPRILELYLNIAEFGPGIYGVEAAGQKFFGKAAAELSPLEAARLAAVLPNPRKWRADRPGPYVQARSAAILQLMGYGPRPLPAEGPEPAEEPDAPPLDQLDGPAAPAEQAPAESSPAPQAPADEPEEPAPREPESDSMPGVNPPPENPPTPETEPTPEPLPAEQPPADQAPPQSA